MLSQIVWHICLNNDWERTPDIIKTNLGIADSGSVADSLSNILFQAREIVRKQGTISQKYGEKPAPESKISATLQEALKAYPQLGEQILTSQSIKLRDFPNPARPSIKNWIYEYTLSLGYDQHSSFARNNFLFQNENAKTLGNQDKQKLSYILKAFDEKTPLMIDGATKLVIFPEMETANRPAPGPIPTNQQQSAKPAPLPPRNTFSSPPANWQNSHSFPENHQASKAPEKTDSPLSFDKRPESLAAASNMKFSSPQKLPYEKAKEPETSPRPIEKKPDPIQPQPVRSQPKPLIISSGYRQKQEPQEEEKQSLPRNVVNLKE